MKNSVSFFVVILPILGYFVVFLLYDLDKSVNNKNEIYWPYDKGDISKQVKNSKNYHDLYVVSLQDVKGSDPHNKDRLQKFKESWSGVHTFQKINVCPGVLDKRRGYGLTKAYIHCFKRAWQDGASHPIFLEDDARFFTKAHFENEKWDDIPSNAFIIMLGGHAWKYGRKRQGRYRQSVYSLGSYGFLVPRNNLKSLIHRFEHDIESGQSTLSPDISWYKAAELANKIIYAVEPLMIQHLAGWSNTFHKHRALISNGGPTVPTFVSNFTKVQSKYNQTQSLFLGHILEKRGYSTGVQLGGGQHHFSERILEKWKNCKKYVLVDSRTPIYSHEQDVENKHLGDQNNFYQYAEANTKKWNIDICQNFTRICPLAYENQSFDFIYVDARQDYTGVTQDLENWFPKLKTGGIVAGYAYVPVADQLNHHKITDWERNVDESSDITRRAVLGAVDDFFGLLNHPLILVDTTDLWKTWVIDTSLVYETNKVPKVFHFVWLSVNWDDPQPEIPYNILNIIQNWKQLYPNWYIVIWTNSMVRQHFSNIVPVLRRIKIASWASDILRYHVIAKYGGVYLDTDIVPLRVLPETLLYTAFTVCERPRDGKTCKIACNAVIASRPENPAIMQAASEALRRSQARIHKKTNAPYDVYLTGPVFWSEMVSKSEFSIMILPPRTFFPCDYSEKNKCKKNLYEHDENVYAMHTWDKSWAAGKKQS